MAPLNGGPPPRTPPRPEVGFAGASRRAFEGEPGRDLLPDGMTGPRIPRTLGSMSLVAFLDNPRRTADAAAPPDPRPVRFHRSMAGYAPSALVEAPAAAAEIGLSRLVVKLETERFGLPSFKVLGASWAACRALSLRAGVEPAATFDELRRTCVRLDGLTLVTARRTETTAAP
jgi:hypothetical protein